MAQGTSPGHIDDLIQQFCAITDASEDAGRHLLEACGGDLQMAVGMHLDGGGATGEDGTTTSAGPSQPRSNAANAQHTSRKRHSPDLTDFGPSPESEVRDPIPQKHEVLVADQLHTFGPRPKRRAARSVFDGFRDFQAEARQQAAGSKAGPTGKVKTLEDLFRPPLDLLHKGTFQSAKEAGCQCNKWLLVNVQDVKEFQCQVLNRDLWSNDAVRSIVRSKFILWQVYSDGDDGKRFAQYYNVHSWPYIAVLDPQTGENMVSWDKFDAITFCDLLTEFLTLHPSPHGSTSDSPPNKKARADSIIDSSEDSQLEAALQASMNQAQASVFTVSDDENSPTSDITSDEELETFSDSETNDDDVADKKVGKKATVGKSVCSVVKAKDRASNGEVEKLENGALITDGSEGGSDVQSNESEEWKQHLGKTSAATCQVVFRLPRGSRSQLTVPVTSKLRALVMYAVSQGYSNERYELMTTFPRRKLSYEDFDQTLESLNFHAQETIFVQER